MTVWSISFTAETTRLLAWKPRWKAIRLVSSSSMETPETLSRYSSMKLSLAWAALMASVMLPKLLHGPVNTCLHGAEWDVPTAGQLGIGSRDNAYIPQRVKHLPVKLKIRQLAAGDEASAVLSEEGEVFAWGWNGNQQFGQYLQDLQLPALFEGGGGGGGEARRPKK